MRRLLIMPVIVLALVFTPIGMNGVSAQNAACAGPNSGVDHALEQATVPGRAGDNTPPGQVQFVTDTVTDSNPEVPAGGCP